jgi:hypothetical protein
MIKEDQKELFARAVEIARQIAAGEIDPNAGCAEIGRINDALIWPEELGALGMLAHEQTGHEHLGITAENCVPDILTEARKLAEQHSQQAPGT